MRALFRTGFSWALTLAFAAGSAEAETVIFSGMFDGSEPTVPTIRQAGADQTARQLSARGIREISLRVSESGVYRLQNLSWFSWYPNTAEVDINIFEGHWGRAAQPLMGRGDYGDEYLLEADRDYRVVLQHCCEHLEQSWVVVAQGPGAIDSDAKAELPDFSVGELTAADPTMTSECGSLWGDWGWPPVRNAPYRQVGPIRVKRAGLYYYASLGYGPFDEVPTCLSVYSAPVDPAEPYTNRLAFQDSGATLWLEPERDYYLVTHWSGFAGSKRYGRYTLLLAEPAPLRLNPGFSGSWYDPDRPGRGYFLSVSDNANQVLLSQFTFAPGADSAGSDVQHLWTTAQGAFAGGRARLDVYLTENGAFDAPAPSPQSRRVGTLDLEFSDCAHGRIDYLPLEDAPPGLDSPTQTTIRRLAYDSVELCEKQFAGPDKIGPW